MKKPLLFLAFAMGIFACNPTQKSEGNAADKTFARFEDIFLDDYWQHYPVASIYNGYGKYYDSLVVPNAAAYAKDIAFSKQWLDALNQLPFNQLSDNNKISYNVIKNQLESDNWYVSVFKQQEWNPAIYNVAGECDYIINQPYAPLNERLLTLSNHIQNTEAYYKAAINNLNKPTKEHLELAIIQNQGGLSVFGDALMDSIKISNLSTSEKGVNHNFAFLSLR
jgi:Bacterial protein of unknown function (DUF885)